MNGNPMQMLMQFMASGKNPQQVLQQVMQQHPQVHALMNQMRQSGMNPRQFAQQYLKQNNIDINQIQQIAQNNGIKL